MVGVAESPRKKVYVEGHGCSASLADTEILQGLIEHGGYELVEDQLAADVSVLVTCSVKSVTEERMISRIRDISQNGARRLIVAGCLPKADPAKIKSINPALSMIGPGNLDQIVPTINDALSGKRTIALESSKLVKLGMPRSRMNKVVGIVEISSGCQSGCTFCQVKLVKGNVFSYPEDQIVDEVRNMIAHGSKEIWLTSTDNAAYGRDSKTTLPRLIRKVTSLKGNFKIRVGMMNPLLTRNLADELVDCFKDEKVFKFIHLPVQSGSERVLKLMRRGYRLDDFYEIVEVFRNTIHGITLSTDMIVGFPTETESEFEESQELLKKVRPEIVNISRFGPRRGTIASTLEGQIDASTSKSRSMRMTGLVKQIQRVTNSNWIGWKGRVLIDEIVKDAVVGRNFAYKPCLFTKDQLPLTAEILGKEVIGCVNSCTSSTLRMDVCDC